MQCIQYILYIVFYEIYSIYYIIWGQNKVACRKWKCLKSVWWVGCVCVRGEGVTLSYEYSKETLVAMIRLDLFASTMKY